MKPKVINISQAPKGWEWDSQYVYIGRPGRGRSGYLGNPIVVGSPGICPVCARFGAHKEPGSTLVCYEKWLRLKIIESPAYRDEVKALKGKTLICFCKPKPCHGDILAQVCLELNEEN